MSAIVRDIKYFLGLPLTSDLEPHHFELPAPILSRLLGYRVCFSVHDILRVSPKELCLWILLTLSLTVVGSFLKTFPPFGSWDFPLPAFWLFSEFVSVSLALYTIEILWFPS